MPAASVSPSAAPALWVVGDVHGERDKLLTLLRRAGLADAGGRWSGGEAALVCIGDYTDRGPDGLGVIRLLMNLEEDARHAGGQLHALLGNHEVSLLAARRFGDSWRDRRGRSWLERWRDGGGKRADLLGLTDRHVDWLVRRPAVLRLGDHLFIHSDSRVYLNYGATLAGINKGVHEHLTSADPLGWDELARALTERQDFVGQVGLPRARELLRPLGGERLVHGHTPIAYVLSVPAGEVRGPLLYAEGTCLNVDGGMAFHPAAGFIVKLGERGVEEVFGLEGEEGLSAAPPPGS